ncbi:Outer membrane usher protein FimD precursor [compost metagenome]
MLVAAPGAAGSRVSNSSGLRLDSRGYAISPWAPPYRESSVALDVTTLPDGVDSDGASRRVVPTRDAIVRADFNTVQGQQALMTLKYHGKPLPFGATVTSGSTGGIVGDDGQVYLAGLVPQGALRAQWGRGAGQQCTVQYQMPAVVATPSVVHITEDCR